MDQQSTEEGITEIAFEGVFAISKPPTVTTPQVLLNLQNFFLPSHTFGSLLAQTRLARAAQLATHLPDQTPRDPEPNGRPFRMGHGGTLDPMASGVLIVGIGRGTKTLSRFLGGTKTYETVVVFGMSTDSFDVQGAVTGRAETKSVTQKVVSSALKQFKGVFMQCPPVYSAIKIDGIKAVEYIRQGKKLPRNLAAREVHVETCELLEFMAGGTHGNHICDSEEDVSLSSAPAVRIRLTVSSGFYVRSFAHDLGIACGTLATMAALVRTRQSNFALQDDHDLPELSPAIPYAELETGEHVWGPKVKRQLSRWMKENPDRSKEHNSGHRKEEGGETRHRFRGEWLATTKKERIKQQGGKVKGKYSRRRNVKEESVAQVEGGGKNIYSELDAIVE